MNIVMDEETYNKIIEIYKFQELINSTKCNYSMPVNLDLGWQKIKYFAEKRDILLSSISLDDWIAWKQNNIERKHVK